MKRLLNMKKSLNIFLAVVFLVTGVTTAQNARFSTLIKANEKAKLSVVKKAGKPGVATITMIVIDPYPMGAGGFQMVLDKDALLADDINNYFDSIAYTMDWGIVYSDYGDYFIPEGATPTLDNPEVGTHEDTISIEVPPGIYDYVVTQLYVDYGIIAEVMGQDYLPCRVNNFEFQAGYEYVFTLEYSMLSLAVEYDAALTSITLPAPSADLTQDAVKVTLKNAGKHSFSNVELSYSVNDSTPVVETFTDTLEPGGITTYTFNTVADFSQTGVYEVTATVNYNEDLNLTNNTIFGSTEKIDTTPDLTFAGVIVPRNSCELGTENTLGVKVSNIGTLNCTKGFTLSYKVGNSAAVQQTFTQTIEKNATETIYFDVKADLSAVNNHEIIFTVSTPVDKDTSNNEIRAIVRHYAPVTELPFESVFANEAARNDWYVGEGEILGISNGWAYDSMGEPARLMYQVGSDMPLLSRCITFAPGLYRFAFSYRGGFFSPFGGANTYTDFYVAYGKSGTDPKLWTPAKEYNDCLTRDPVTGEILINITEQGDYVFGIFPKNLEVIRLYSVSISNVLEHDMRINSVVVPESIARLMPKSQIAGEKTFALTVENFGATAAESGTVELKLGATVLASENISFDSLAQVKNVNITADFETLSAGSKKLIFEAKTNNNVTSRQEISFTVSDSVFAWDNLDNGFGASVGHRAPGGLGVVYEISNEDILTSITVGLPPFEPSSSSNLGLAVYPVGDSLRLGDALLQVEYPRTLGNNNKGITFDISDLELQSGKYYFEVIQKDSNNIAIAYDGNATRGIFYENFTTPGTIVQLLYGTLHIRPNFSDGSAGISPVAAAPAGRLVLYPNPASVSTGLNVRLEGVDGKIEKITVYDISGKIVNIASDVNASEYKVNTGALKAGVYFVSVESKNAIIVSKFIVK